MEPTLAFFVRELQDADWKDSQYADIRSTKAETPTALLMTIMERAMQDRDWENRQYVASALGAMGETTSQVSLQTTLKQSLEALLEVLEMESISPLLEQSAQDLFRVVRRYAAAVLGKLMKQGVRICENRDQPDGLQQWKVQTVKELRQWDRPKP
jgi:hypothetical protein